MLEHFLPPQKIPFTIPQLIPTLTASPRPALICFLSLGILFLWPFHGNGIIQSWSYIFHKQCGFRGISPINGRAASVDSYKQQTWHLKELVRIGHCLSFPSLVVECRFVFARLLSPFHHSFFLFSFFSITSRNVWSTNPVPRNRGHP